MPRTLSADSKRSLGANLREARERRGWKQGEAALRADVPRVRLNKWENGRETPGTEGLIRLAVTYNCPVDDLLGGVDEAYDAIIESRIPIDVRRHYRAHINNYISRTTAAMQLALEPGAPSQRPRGRASAAPRARDKSSPVAIHPRMSRPK